MAQILHTILSPFCYVVFLALREFKEKAPVEFRSLLTFSPPIITRAVLHKFGWWVDPKNPKEFNLPKLKLFWELLVNRELITCSYKEFEIHFIGEKLSFEKIAWADSIELLVLLFHRLVFDKKIMPQGNSLYALLCGHFKILDKKKNVMKSLKQNSLPVHFIHATGKKDLEKIVEDISYLLLS